MLVLVHLILFLRLAHPHPGLNVDIIIHAIDVGESMVDDIVFHIPHKTIPAEYIERKCSKMIYPFIFTETAMRAIVHHIESNSCNYAAQQHTFGNGKKNARSEKNKMYINEGKGQHQDYSL